jgi:hypothetical protein
MEKKNIAWINTCKALCMIFVYLNHSCIVLGALLGRYDDWYFALYVNSFFVISGYLLFRKQLSTPIVTETCKQYVMKGGGGKSLIDSIVWRIAIPTAIFSLINFFPKKLLRGQPFYLKELILDTFGGCSMWFTCALVVAELLLLVMLFTRCKNVWVYVVGAILLSTIGVVAAQNGAVFPSMPKQFPWWWKNGLVATIYMVAGGVLWKYESTIHGLFSIKGVLPLAVVIYLSLLYGLHGHLKYMVAINSLNMPGSLVSLFGVVTLIEICRYIPSIGLIQDMGRNTLGYYFFCGASPVVVGIVIKRFAGTGYLSLLLVLFISLLLSRITVAIINRYVPFLFDLRLLNKKTK